MILVDYEGRFSIDSLMLLVALDVDALEDARQSKLLHIVDDVEQPCNAPDVFIAGVDGNVLVEDALLPMIADRNTLCVDVV